MYFGRCIFCFVLLVEIFVVGVQAHTEIGATSSKNKGKIFSFSLCSDHMFILVNSIECEFPLGGRVFVLCDAHVNENDVKTFMCVRVGCEGMRQWRRPFKMDSIG